MLQDGLSGTQSRAASESGGPNAAWPRVLVVEDDAAIREVLQVALGDEGFAVVTAGDGAEALARVAASSPHVIVLDVRMPVMDGPTFMRRYRQRPPPHAPIVAIAASQQGLKEAEDVGVAAALAKPFDLDDLVATVRRFADA